MAINLASLHKLESMPASVLARRHDARERLLVLVKLRPGGKKPDYLCVRAEFSEQLFSAELTASDLERLETDPAVESVSISRSVPSL